MSYTIKKQKIWIALILVTISTLIGLMIALAPSLVTAQEPEGDKPGSPEDPTNPEERFPAFDLQVNQTTTTPAVTSGNFATFIITIRNNGPNPARLVQFWIDAPTQMSQISYQFSVGDTAFDGHIWTFEDPINSGNTAVVTVTGRLNSLSSLNVTNVANVRPANAGDDPNMANNQSSVVVALTGSNPGSGTIYFPSIFRFPQPTLFLVYTENFESSDAWGEFSSDNCTTENQGGRYVVDIEGADKNCLPVADNGDDKPEQPFRKHGEFEVEVYRSEGGGDDFSYGIFINGEGGDNYYLFRVWPNNSCSSGGSWRLFRRKDGNESSVDRGDCVSAINRGGGTNRLRIAHTLSSQLIVYANGVQLNTTPYTDNNDLDGEATGVYAHTDEDDIVIKFDNFKVFRYTGG